jgi:hypothetical protein
LTFFLKIEQGKYLGIGFIIISEVTKGMSMNLMRLQKIRFGVFHRWTRIIRLTTPSSDAAKQLTGAWLLS